MAENRDETSGASAKIDVYIVDDHPLIRDGLASFIRMQPDMQVTGSGSGIAEVLRDLPHVHVDVMLIDLTLGNESGADLLVHVCRDFPYIKPLIFTMHRSEQLLHQMLGRGARGFVLKEDPTNTVLQGIRAVMAGGVFFSQSLNQPEGAPEKSPVSSLTPSEASLARLLTSARRSGKYRYSGPPSA